MSRGNQDAISSATQFGAAVDGTDAKIGGMTSEVDAAQPVRATPAAGKWTARSLHFAIPIGRGDHVATYGAPPTLVRSLGHDAVRTTVVETWPVASTMPVDHAIALTSSTQEAVDVVREMSEAVPAGGWLLLAAPHVRRVGRRLGTDPSTARITRTLTERGFEDIEVLGMRHSMDNPQHLVPIDHAGAVRWFLTSACQPGSLRGAIVLLGMSTLSSRRAGSLVFPSLAFVARRAQC